MEAVYSIKLEAGHSIKRTLNWEEYSSAGTVEVKRKGIQGEEERCVENEFVSNLWYGDPATWPRCDDCVQTEFRGTRA